MQSRVSASEPQLVADQYKNNKNVSNKTLATDVAVDHRVFFSERFACLMEAYHEGSLQYRIDDATLAYKHSHSSIPVRLISALASGKTWFEKELPGLKLFDSRNLPIQSHHTIYQNGDLRARSLQELQLLTLIKWYDMLNDDGRESLRTLQQEFLAQNTHAYSIFRKNKQIKNSQEKANVGDETLQALTIAVCRDARSKKTVTPELYELFHLLCGNIALDFGNIPLDKKSSDYWVKSRVHQLLWGSYIWVQRNIDDESKKTLLL